MFYLIGIGLNKDSITAEALKSIKTCDKVYLENYTVDFPYLIKDLEKSINTKITLLIREKIEDESILNQAKKQNIALLVYGDALSATTHTQLIIAAKKQKIPFKILHNSSILTAIAETGLSLYKFGKTTSLPNWKQHTNKPTSFIDYIKQNQSIKAHTLLLVDIGLELKDSKSQLIDAFTKEFGNPKVLENTSTNRVGEQFALSNKLKQKQLRNANREFSAKAELKEGNLISKHKIILISNLGTNKQKILYNTLEKLPNKINKPYAFIIPSDFNLAEQEFLNYLY